MEDKVSFSQNQSPTQTKSDWSQMNFYSALKELVEGRRVRRLEWEDKDIYLTFHNEQLMIFLTKDKMLHQLIVQLGDVVGEDWVVIK
jgi:hypothetical protein